MPLISAKDFQFNPQPRGNQVNEAILQLIGGIKKKSQDDALLKAKTFQKQAKTDAAQLARVRDMTDPQAQRREIAILGQNAIKEGRDATVFMEALNASTPDMLNLALSRSITKMSDADKQIAEAVKKAQPQSPQGKVQADVQAGFLTPEQAVTTKAQTPQTAIGKARQDLKNKLITQSEFNTIKNTPKSFQTDIGKTISDRQLAITMFGEDSPQVQAFNEAIESDKKGEGPKLTDVAGIRKEFTKQSGDFIKINDAFNKLQSAPNSPAGDISLIFSFMKINDPGSTVREGEFATAENSAGIPERVRTQYNKALTGEKLGDIQRADFRSSAKALYDAQLNNQRNLEKIYTGLATRQKIDPQDVVLDFVGNVVEPGQGGELSAEEAEELRLLEAKHGNR